MKIYSECIAIGNGVASFKVVCYSEYDNNGYRDKVATYNILVDSNYKVDSSWYGESLKDQTLRKEQEMNAIEEVKRRAKFIFDKTANKE